MASHRQAAAVSYWRLYNCEQHGYFIKLLPIPKLMHPPRLVNNNGHLGSGLGFGGFTDGGSDDGGGLAGVIVGGGLVGGLAGAIVDGGMAGPIVGGDLIGGLVGAIVDGGLAGVIVDGGLAGVGTGARHGLGGSFPSTVEPKIKRTIMKNIVELLVCLVAIVTYVYGCF